MVRFSKTKCLQRVGKCVLLSGLLTLIAVLMLVHRNEECSVKHFQEESIFRFSTKCRSEFYERFRLTSKNSDKCSSIIKGDPEAVELTRLERILRNKQSAVNESVYLNMTQDCYSFKTSQKYITFPLSREEEDFPIAYSMVIHENIEMFERLLRAIYAPQNIYCIHVDKKSPKQFMQAVGAIASCFDNVFLATKQENVVYASWSRVQADLNCMEDLLRSKAQWHYLINTCGSDFPIKTNAEIVKILKILNGKNSMESIKTPGNKKYRWMFHYDVNKSVVRTNTKKSQPPITTPMFAGNAYFVVTREFVKHLFVDSVVQKLIEWEKDTYSPDEHLWATLQRMPGVPGSYQQNSEYDTSDMISFARLVKWIYSEGDINKGALYTPCTGTHRHGVCIYGAGDLQWILQNRHLFANKFDLTVDRTAFECLEEYLRHKAFYGEGL
ncbi:beta-1,3-galactosyl-O-glycosyl-glycoprotein beta-1,6-N-acetylglucosaminyltransferase 3-like [Protopterus annectens]|uniref:beta-1,3-galactosyl-O-glycosyl-glycoprotein beta-1,6-N-acetylglucosaminyltransferase 3-like n=1 Tax=Protopterus annectens TaxID=7888 RepID=UPI001CFB32AC|nr:beta-1,3-galactosyl-O-glycosyl-glycoprotein beta-1,6-N-acetylglucosaminyltransferase 3-like [Protopterus annectens]